MEMGWVSGSGCILKDHLVVYQNALHKSCKNMYFKQQDVRLFTEEWKRDWERILKSLPNWQCQVTMDGMNEGQSIFPRLQGHGGRQMDEHRSHDHLLSIHWYSFVQLLVPGSPGHHIYCFPWAKSWVAWLKQSQATYFTSGPCSFSPLPPWPAFGQAFITKNHNTKLLSDPPQVEFPCCLSILEPSVMIPSTQHTISYCALSSGSLGMVTLGPE